MGDINVCLTSWDNEKNVKSVVKIPLLVLAQLPLGTVISAPPVATEMDWYEKLVITGICEYDIYVTCGHITRHEGSYHISPTECSVNRKG